QNWFKTLDAENMPEYINKLSEATLVPVPEDSPANYQAMSWDTVRELEKKGIMFGPHTRSHLILSRLDNQNARREIEHSWTRLTEELVSPTPIFCYPTGRDSDFTQREVDNLIRMGLKGAISTQPTFIDMACTTNNDIYRLPRFSFPGSHIDFVQYSSWIERAKKHLLRG
ncbi:MAG: polysaccharide deacetylase family protein, partial [Gammaproteobacteria bacterium]|nr:polysaccharide deacetylase family protein [Gammaproteobacteria bacterium]